MYIYDVFVSARLVAAETNRERRLFRSALAQVRLLFESGVYSREASIRSYTVCARKYGDQLFQVICLAEEDVNTRNNQVLCLRLPIVVFVLGYSAGNCL